MAESGGNPNAYNPSNRDGTNDAGLFQINSVHTPHLITDEGRFDPKQNMAAAYAIYRERLALTGNGWTAWSAYNNGAYKEHLK